MAEELRRLQLEAVTQDALRLSVTYLPAQGEPIMLGITKASLSTDSFISASSF